MDSCCFQIAGEQWVAEQAVLSCALLRDEYLQFVFVLVWHREILFNCHSGTLKGTCRVSCRSDVM